MTGRELLKECYNVHYELVSLTDRVQGIWDTLTNVSPAPPGTGGGHVAPTGDKILKGIAKILEIEESVTERMKYIDSIQESASLIINSLESPMARDVMRFRYINHWKWSRIAETLDVKEEYIYKVHRCAMREIDKTYDGVLF